MKDNAISVFICVWRLVCLDIFNYVDKTEMNMGIQDRQTNQQQVYKKFLSNGGFRGIKLITVAM